MSECYKGQEGCLKFIVDILDDYDGCKTVETLKELIDEARKEAIQGIVKGEDYSK